MKKINEKENILEFQANISDTIANAIRRYMGHINVLAIDELEISKNDSPLYDETIAHRIGLIPLKTPKNVGESTEKELELKTKKEGVVYSGELIGDAEIVYDNIPITLLNKGQEMNIKAFARTGKGKNHAKFSPGLMFYNELVEVKVKDCPNFVVNSCPKGILKEENGKVVVDENLKYDCDSCEACIEALKKVGKEGCIELSPKGELVITIESFGQLNTKDIFTLALNELKKDFQELEKKLK